jgi:hypothetical protein
VAKKKQTKEPMKKILKSEGATTMALSIESGDDLYTQLIKYLSDESFLEGKALNLPNELKKISIHITGSAFNSSVPSRAMRAFLELQDAIWSMYSIYVYGEKRRLASSVRSALEIDVIVQEGSSWYEVPLENISKAISERVKTMTGKELAGVTAAACLAVLAATFGSKAIDHKTEIEKLKEMRQTTTDVQQNTADALVKAMESQQSFYRIISSQSYDTLEINGELFTHEELREMVKVSRTKYPIEQKIYSGKYRITDIHIGEETIYLDVIGSGTGKVIKNVNLLKGIISENDYQWFKDSADGQEVDMTIVATEKNSEIIASFLQTFSIPNKKSPPQGLNLTHNSGYDYTAPPRSVTAKSKKSKKQKKEGKKGQRR